jgi:hypothetical protein
MWSPDKISNRELNILLDYLRKGGDDYKNLYDKFWCWKLNYRKKDHDNFLQ